MWSLITSTDDYQSACVSSSKEIFQKNRLFCAQFFIIHNFCHWNEIKRISSPFLFQFSMSKTASKGIETWKDVTCLKYRFQIVEADWQPLLNDATICYANQSLTPHHVSTLSNRTVSNGPSSRTLPPLSIYVFRAIYRIGTRNLSGLTRVVERKALDLQLDHLYRWPVWIDQLTGIDRWRRRRPMWSWCKVSGVAMRAACI